MKHQKKGMERFNQIIIWTLRLSAFFVFFGRGWEHLFWDAPFRAVLWDQTLMEGLVTKFTDMTWQQYATSVKVNFIIDTSIKLIGVVYLFCAVLSLTIMSKHKKMSKALLVGAFFLVILSFLFYKNKFYKFGQFIEYSCQMFSPVFLYLFLFYKMQANKFHLLLKIALALTFIGHGLYALGIYVTPGIWTDMAMSSLNFAGLYPSEVQVENIIYIAGILDMILAVGIFLPKKWSIPFIAWAIIWGLLTSLSRVIGFMNFDPSWHTLFQWLPQTIMRMPHMLIPLAVLWYTFFNTKILFFKNKRKVVLNH